jgi:hypothetical protein
MPVHLAMLALIEKTDLDPYYGVQLRKMLKQIGDDGRYTPSLYVSQVLQFFYCRLMHTRSHASRMVANFDVMLD